MKRRDIAWFALFPMLGSVLALGFRPSERDLRSFNPARNPASLRDRLSLPGGGRLELIQVAGDDAFWLSEIEFPAKLWRALRPDARPENGSASGMTHAEARAFCAWLSERSGRRVRLPRAEEWRRAARGSAQNAETPWGYGTNPPRDVAFARGGKPVAPGPALGWGFRDLAGGLWEWTEEGLLLGGAWPERDPGHLRIDAQWAPPADYAGADTGFRVLVEIDNPDDSARKLP